MSLIMENSKKKPLPADLHNPFEGRNPDEVWNELKKNAKHISREDLMRRFQSQREKNTK